MPKAKHGDTIIEVLVSITVFSMVAVLAMSMMNRGVNTAQRSLEFTMARTAIDSQAEALRFIHNNYVAERSDAQGRSYYGELWSELTKYAVKTNAAKDDAFNVNSSSYSSCEDAYNALAGDANPSFIINPRLLLPSSIKKYHRSSYNGLLTNKNMGGTGNARIIIPVNTAPLTKDVEVSLSNTLYPRIIYRNWRHEAGRTDWNSDSSLIDGTNDPAKAASLYQVVRRVEGIWINAVPSGTNFDRSDFIDFYIRTCWHSPGSNAPSTNTTAVRLYNPEVIQK
ncbi:hypothetical protein IKF15_00915 [Candidatus Saccharibacteria bacterium]|nr:hypothetical protein [Candidatus Saccharibacteria bacterium]